MGKAELPPVGLPQAQQEEAQALRQQLRVGGESLQPRDQGHRPDEECEALAGAEEGQGALPEGAQRMGAPAQLLLEGPHRRLRDIVQEVAVQHAQEDAEGGALPHGRPDLPGCGVQPRGPGQVPGQALLVPEPVVELFPEELLSGDIRN